MKRFLLSPVAAMLVLSAALALTGCGRRPMPMMPVPEVHTVTVKAQAVALTTELPGRTVPSKIAEIRPQVSGLVIERKFVEGSYVRKDSTLYQIDPAPYQSAVDQAAATLATTEARVPALRSRSERLASLAQIHAAGQQDADDARAAFLSGEASVNAAKAVLESARINLGYTPVRTPISGRIGRSAVTIGAMVTAYQPVPLAVVQQLDPIYVDVTQSSADLLKLRRALASGALKTDEEKTARVKLLLEDGTPYPLTGTFQFRDVTVDPSTGSVVLRMTFPNPDGTLLPGMYVRALITQAVEQSAILAPQQGVTHNAKGEAIALVVGGDGKVEQRVLEVGRAVGDQWVVTKGLAAGDRVIVEGLQKVKPGVPVKASELVPAGGDATADSQRQPAVGERRSSPQPATTR